MRIRSPLNFSLPPPSAFPLSGSFQPRCVAPALKFPENSDWKSSPCPRSPFPRCLSAPLVSALLPLLFFYFYLQKINIYLLFILVILTGSLLHLSRTLGLLGNLHRGKVWLHKADTRLLERGLGLHFYELDFRLNWEFLNIINKYLFLDIVFLIFNIN